MCFDCSFFLFFFFFNDTATTEIYTLSLHDALPIRSHSRSARTRRRSGPKALGLSGTGEGSPGRGESDRKSTRLNSSHGYISYAVFCLKKKNFIQNFKVKDGDNKQISTKK